jgi:hypothetical protein
VCVVLQRLFLFSASPEASQVFWVLASDQAGHSTGTLHLKHECWDRGLLASQYEWRVFRSANRHKNREVTHELGYNCLLWESVVMFHKSEVPLLLDMCNTYAVMFIGYSPTLISDLISNSWNVVLKVTLILKYLMRDSCEGDVQSCLEFCAGSQRF